MYPSWIQKWCLVFAARDRYAREPGGDPAPTRRTVMR